MMLRGLDQAAMTPVEFHPPPRLSEPGYTLFGMSSGDLERTAGLLSADMDAVAKLLSEPGLPLARTSGMAEAEALANSLSDAGVTTRIVGDQEFVLGQPSIRVSAIEIAADTIVVTDFNTRLRTLIPAKDLVLFVEGTIAKSRTDSLSKGRGRGSKTVNESVTTLDEPVLDVYTALFPVGLRIVPSGFDFSVLGELKRLTAAENWRTLLTILAERFSGARVDRSYNQLRRFLELSWPLDMQLSSTGKVISGFGRRDFGTVALASNLKQFNIYSRSRRYFL